ncbi:MAG: SsrA-binding protein SmpB [Puniceicoccales bacterium]|jgi:SsrA-binding protein|nr:SsrA-binding protein SmpB [Puniceicoccales bacterium]
MAGKVKGAKHFAEVFNRKALHRYAIVEELEAGIELRGTEIKAVREGRAQISEAFVRINHNGRPQLFNAHIEAYSHGSDANHPANRVRNLLLHRREICKLRTEAEKDGMAIIPLRLHMKRGLLKVDIALCRGKNLRDKREELRRTTALREAQREMSERYVSQK